MPDHIGAFLKADQVISALGLNITRVSYNKAIDVHMLFLEVEGSEEQLAAADRELTALGYLNGDAKAGNVILIEFQLRDKLGTLLPVLELIHQYRFNISFISSTQTGSDYQYFKMGLFVDDDEKISEFVNKAVRLCPIRFIDYDQSEKVLDNTVFYITFANEISEKMGFGEEEKSELIVHSNHVMQILEERDSSPRKTFEYIARFAEQLRKHRKEGFCARVTRSELSRGRELLLIEPPCGSNICVVDCGSTLVFVDSGFACYQEELWALLEREIPDFSARKKELILTHADVDHAGCADWFDKIYLSRGCYENFLKEKRGEANFREENPLHAPYVRISKLLTGYHPPKLGEDCVFDLPSEADAPLAEAGTLSVGGLTFSLYVGKGGHVSGETVFVERDEKLVFTGDVFVNIKGFTKEQADFNRLAPYLMTSVDTDPELAKKERSALFELLGPGQWQIFGGHGAMLCREQE